MEKLCKKRLSLEFCYQGLNNKFRQTFYHFTKFITLSTIIMNTTTFSESKMIKSGDRNIFVDLKSSKTGKPYVHLCESRMVDGKYERQRFYLFERDIQKLSQILNDYNALLGEVKPEE